MGVASNFRNRIWTASTRGLLAVVLSGLPALSLTCASSGCQGCHNAKTTAVTEGPLAEAPSLRLYVLTNVAGALEPCGCSKDQLGGVQHLSAFLTAQQKAAPNSLVVGAGPLFFLNPTVAENRATQEAWNAEALSESLKLLGVSAWAPAANDWALGSARLESLSKTADVSLLGANLDGSPKLAQTLMREVSGIKVGIVGVSDPKIAGGAYPESLKSNDIGVAVETSLEKLKREGAQVLVLLAALPRGDALRLGDRFPELNLIVLGKPSQSGDQNDTPKAPVLLGSTLAIEPSNHLQTLSIVDLYIRQKSSPISFADGSGISRAEAVLAISDRIREIEHKINSWEKEPNARPEDVAARKSELQKLRGEKLQLEVPLPAPTGNYFRYQLLEVRKDLGTNASVNEALLSYYKRVNEHNKSAFADRKPEPAEKGQASYIGIEACTSCHDEERAVWDKTAHAHAYATLQKDFKEYNLDCVSCHVTGYERKGGSTVTWNDKLQNVQCEQCHGPGSLHAKDPEKPGLVTASPSAQSCVTQCHHSPHVEGFDAIGKMKFILGRGHGQ